MDEAARIRNLQTGMAAAMDADRRKQEINDAKMRAVAQRVDYDQFCAFVAGAHLKPVKPIDKDGAGANGFNFFVMPSSKTDAPAPPSVDPVAASIASPFSAAATGLRVPKNGLDFHKTWRRQCKTVETRAAYLRLVDAQLIPTVFQTEFEPDILDGIVHTLDQLLHADDLPALAAAALARAGEGADADAERLSEDVHMAASWLTMLPEVNKFALALEFCAAETRPALQRLFAGLRAKSCAQLPRGSERLRQELKELLAPRTLDETEAKYGADQ